MYAAILVSSPLLKASRKAERVWPAGVSGMVTGTCAKAGRGQISINTIRARRSADGSDGFEDLEPREGVNGSSWETGPGKVAVGQAGRWIVSVVIDRIIIRRACLREDIAAKWQSLCVYLVLKCQVQRNLRKIP